MQHSLRKSSYFWLLCVAVGCAGHDDHDDAPAGSTPAGDGFSSSLPQAAELGALDERQSQTLCSELDAYGVESGFVDDFVEYVCRVSGALAAASASPETDSDARATCRGAFDQCVAAAMASVAEPKPSDSECDQHPASCTATIGEYSACVSEGVSAVHAALQRAPTCDTLTLDDLDFSEDVWGVETPLCDAVEAKCATLPGPTG